VTGEPVAEVGEAAEEVAKRRSWVIDTRPLRGVAYRAASGSQ